MSASKYRAKAREVLNGKWSKGVLIVLAYMVFTILISFVEGLFQKALLGSMISLFLVAIEIPISFGLVFAFLKLYNNEQVKAFDYITLGFSNFSRAFETTFWILLKMILPIILMVISIVMIASSLVLSITGGGAILSVISCILLIISIVWATMKSYYYQIAQYIVIENPEMSIKEAIMKSEDLMTNNRLRLFGLHLSFIGWSILSMLTFGIGFLWLVPYMQFASIAFYKDLIKVEEKNIA